MDEDRLFKILSYIGDLEKIKEDDVFCVESRKFNTVFDTYFGHYIIIKISIRYHF